MKEEELLHVILQNIIQEVAQLMENDCGNAGRNWLDKMWPLFNELIKGNK